MLRQRIELAIMAESPSAVDRALHAVQQSTIDPTDRFALENLLRGARAALAGDAAQGLATLDRIGTIASPELDYLRQAMRVQAAQRLDLQTHAAVVESAIDPAAPDARSGWLGMLRYRQGDYPEAARLAEAIATHPGNPQRRVGAMTNAAGAWLEAGDLDAAWRLASDAERLARAVRHPVREAQARWCRRTIEYRSGRILAPDPALVDAAAAVGRRWEGVFALLEASCAWRQGDRDLASALALRAHNAMTAAQHEPSALLALALAAAAGASVDEDDAIGRAARLPPDFQIQILGLLCAGAQPPAPARQEIARALLARLAHLDPDARLDVVSIREAAVALRVALPEDGEE